MGYGSISTDCSNGLRVCFHAQQWAKGLFPRTKGSGPQKLIVKRHAQICIARNGLLPQGSLSASYPRVLAPLH